MLFINQSKLFVITRVYVLLTTTWHIVKKIMLLLFGVDRRNLTFWFLMFTKMKFYKFHFSDYSEWPLFLCGKKNERKSWKTTSKSKYFYLNICSSWNDCNFVNMYFISHSNRYLEQNAVCFKMYIYRIVEQWYIRNT